jgi:hypothetical protein
MCSSAVLLKGWLSLGNRAGILAVGGIDLLDCNRHGDNDQRDQYKPIATDAVPTVFSKRLHCPPPQ